MSEADCTAHSREVNDGKKERFAAVPLDLIPRLMTAGPAACHVYLALAARADFTTGECYPKVSTLADDLGGVHTETVRRAIKALEQIKAVTIRRRFRENGSPDSNVYVVQLVPAPARGPRACAGRGTRASAERVPAPARAELPPVEPPPVEPPKESARFSPPTLDEVNAYVKEKNLTMDPEQFIDHYTANGWMTGRTRMKDWRASVRNWARRQSSFTNGRSQNGKHSTVPGPGQRHDPARPVTWGK